MALDVLFCKDLMVNAENSLVRTFTLFPKHVTFTPWYEQLGLGNTLRPSHQMLKRCPSGWGKGLIEMLAFYSLFYITYMPK